MILNSKLLKVFVLLLSLSLIGVPAATATTNNVYRIEDLPDFTTKKTPFEVEIYGDEAVCAITYNGVTITKAPWRFEYDPIKPVDLAYVKECNDPDLIRVFVFATVPWKLSSTVISKERSGSNRVRDFIVTNVQEPATYQVVDPTGKQVGSGELSDQSYNEYRFQASSKAPTAVYQVKITSKTSNLSITLPVTVTSSWNLSDWQTEMKPIFPRCSTVYWYYSHSKANRSATATSVRADLAESFRRLTSVTGLKFAEVTKLEELPSVNAISIIWNPRVKSAAQAGPKFVGEPDFEQATGLVELNPASWSMSDTYRGFNNSVRSNFKGRGWIFVHEIMHVLGLDHTNDKSQIMYPISGNLTKLGVGDIAGLKALYEPSSCN